MKSHKYIKDLLHYHFLLGDVEEESEEFLPFAA